ncbi:hypothetical protein [Streptomyces sp. NPDC102360]|uniref:hypothetical protein n=1 Tax=Streptomyces sp. NPDC102360 TaxID=3366160 RepID=UPI0037F3B61D
MRPAWAGIRAGWVRAVLVDAGVPGEGVINWSFSWVNASNKTVTRPYFDLNVAGTAAHRAPAGIVGPDGRWHPSGHLRWADDTDALIDTGQDPARQARQVVPGLGPARIARTRVVNRPIPADGFPSVGAVPDVPGYYEPGRFPV